MTILTLYDLLPKVGMLARMCIDIQPKVFREAVYRLGQINGGEARSISCHGLHPI